jgi:hypothetical protein
LAQHLRGGDGWRLYSLREVAAELATYGYTTIRSSRAAAATTTTRTLATPDQRFCCWPWARIEKPIFSIATMH